MFEKVLDRLIISVLCQKNQDTLLKWIFLLNITRIAYIGRGGCDVKFKEDKFKNFFFFSMMWRLLAFREVSFFIFYYIIIIACLYEIFKNIGGGEYDVQLGFGWTNGVVIDFLNNYGDRLWWG
jgi:hypothetical protein